MRGWQLAGVVALTGCHRGGPTPEPVELPPPPEAPAPVDPPAPAPVEAAPELTALVQRLSAHDGVTCAAATEGLADPAEALLSVVQTVSMPPATPMRAADCLLTEHATVPAVREAVLAWVAGEDTKGLALLVGQHLADLPPELAVAAAAAGAAGPHAAALAPSVAQDPRPEVRAVIGAE
ncbi:MAG: hypothetical protein R3F59_22125 [Myxococcota bacterium]